MLLPLLDTQGRQVYLNPEQVDLFRFYNADTLEGPVPAVKCMFPNESYLTVVEEQSYNLVKSYCESAKKEEF